MTSLLVTPELGKSLVWKRGILTVPKEDAAISCDCVARKPCRGLVIRDLPLEAGPLRRYAETMGKRRLRPAVERAEEAEGLPVPPLPSPVDRGQLYVESPPILGVTKTAHVVKQS